VWCPDGSGVVTPVLRPAPRAIRLYISGACDLTADTLRAQPHGAEWAGAAAPAAAATAPLWRLGYLGGNCSSSSTPTAAPPPPSPGAADTCCVQPGTGTTTTHRPSASSPQQHHMAPRVQLVAIRLGHLWLRTTTPTAPTTSSSRSSSSGVGECGRRAPTSSSSRYHHLAGGPVPHTRPPRQP
jgi:hypothetical protein